MKDRKNIEAEIEKTIQSLDSWEQRKAPTFFYTRLKAKIEAPKQIWWVSQLFDLPALKPVLFASIILLNGLTIASVLSLNNSEDTSYETAITSITDEYAFNQSTETYFELNNE